MRRGLASLLVLLAVTTASPAHATFHFMQIEQVIGSVNGDVGSQAVQLRMRSFGQNFVSQGLLWAWDAAGANPVLILAPPTDVSSGVAGSRVLIVSSAFASRNGPTPDFIMTNTIPASYLAAGSLTWEDEFGTVLWRLSWGGAAYTGTGTGALTNDPNGNFSPPFPFSLSTSGNQAVRFTGLAGASSTTNAADYQFTTDDPFFTNNAGQGAPTASVDGPGALAGVQLGPPAPNPARGVVSYTITLPRAMNVRVALMDLAGRRVGTLLDEERPAGLQHLEWDSDRSGSPLPVGVYTLRLEAGGVRQARRIVLVH